MRNNDLLDDAWEEASTPLATPKRHPNSRHNPLLDKEFGLETIDIFEEFRETPKKAIPKPKRNGTPPKPIKRKTRRKKRTVVPPEDAIPMLKHWIKKLETAREKVQKYKAAVRRYRQQGRL